MPIHKNVCPFFRGIPLWPIEYKSSCIVGTAQIHNIPILDIHELSAGKLVALIDRKTGRDLFDAYHLLTNLDIHYEKLRLALIIYSAMNRKIDLRHTMPQDITVNTVDLTNRLVPLLKNDTLNSIESITSWSDHLVKKCQKAFKRFLPITDQEKEFLTRLIDKGSI